MRGSYSCARGTETSTENKLFWNPMEKWLTQLEKGVYGRLSARGVKKKKNVKTSYGRRKKKDKIF